MTSTKDFALNDLKFDKDGLITAIAQDWLDGSILMLAWMNKEAIEKTLQTGKLLIGLVRATNFG